MPKRVYAMRGDVSGELWSYRGQVLVHPNRAEIEFLLAGGRSVEVTLERLGRPWLWLQNHPGLSWVRWPLRREDFRGC